MITNSYSPGDHTFGEFIKHLRMCWPNSLRAGVFNYSQKLAVIRIHWAAQPSLATSESWERRALLKITSWNEFGIDIIRTAWIDLLGQSVTEVKLFYFQRKGDFKVNFEWYLTKNKRTLHF